MGKKIPGKKHRGVKDPEKQRATRLKSLKGKINVPPTNVDFQEIPKSVSRIAELQEQAKRKTGSQTSRLGKKRKLFNQHKGESDKRFLHRVSKACHSVIQEKAFENKYGVDIKRNKQTGEVEKLVKKPKDELDQLMKEARKSKKGKKKKSAKTVEPVLTKSQKRQKKLQVKKQEKHQRNLEFDTTKDVVKFGEIVHQPPTLTIPRKIAKVTGAPRAGARNLLLKSVMFNRTEIDTKTNKHELRKTQNSVIDKKGKRKNLPNAMRRRLDKQQAEIIDAYRMLKKQRNS